MLCRNILRRCSVLHSASYTSAHCVSRSNLVSLHSRSSSHWKLKGYRYRYGGRELSTKTITVPGYGPSSRNKEKKVENLVKPDLSAPLQTRKRVRKLVEDSRNNESDFGTRLAGHLRSKNYELFRQEIKQWMHILRGNLYSSRRNCRSGDEVSINQYKESFSEGVRGMSSLLNLLQNRGGSTVERYPVSKCPHDVDDRAVVLRDIPIDTIIIGLLSERNNEELTPEIVGIAHELLGYTIESLPESSIGVDVAKEMYSKGLSVVPSYWTVLQVLEGHVSILESLEKRNLERDLSALDTIALCWKNLDECLDFFVQAHHFYDKVLESPEQSCEYRGRRVQNQFQVITNNALKALHRTMIQSNSTSAVNFANKWMNALKSFSDTFEVFGPDLNTYTSMILINGKNFDTEKAHAFFEEMKNNGIEPDVIVYNVLMDGYANLLNAKGTAEGSSFQRAIVDDDKALERIHSLFENLQRSSGPQLNDDSYKIYIKALSRTNQQTSAPRAEMVAMELLKLQDSGALIKRKSFRQGKDDYLYNAMIHAWGKNRSEIAEDRAKWWFHSAESHSAATTITYNTMMYFYAERASMDLAACSSAEDIFYRMLSQGIKPSSTSYSTIMSIWSKLNDPVESVNKVCYWYDLLRERCRNDKTITITHRECNMVLMAMSKLKSVDPVTLKKARAIYRMMQNSPDVNIRPTTVTFGAMIKTLASTPIKNSWREAKAMILKSIEESREDIGVNLDGLRPSGHAFASTFSAMATASFNNDAVVNEADELMTVLHNDITRRFNLKVHPQLVHNFMLVLARSSNKDAGSIAEKWMESYQDVYRYREDMTKAEITLLQHTYRNTIEAFVSFQQDQDSFIRANEIYSNAPAIVRHNPYVMLGIMKVASSSKHPDSPNEIIRYSEKMKEIIGHSTFREKFENITRKHLMTSLANCGGNNFEQAKLTMHQQSNSKDPVTEYFLLRYLHCIDCSHESVDKVNTTMDVFHLATEHGICSAKILSALQKMLSTEQYESLAIPKVIPPKWQKRLRYNPRR